jgi:CheY-like chemotaxis protein
MPNSSRSNDSASPKQIEVLVVQSNPADTLLTVEAFHAAGLTAGLRCVTEGEDALSYVRGEGKYADVPTPDLIFQDLSQPRVSGLEVLKVIKSTPALMHIPIVVAAGSDDPQLVGGQGDSVFWQVGSSATLGTSTAFAGNILALTSITLNTTASIGCGRALARNGTVTMDTNVISIDTEGCEATSGGSLDPEPSTASLLLLIGAPALLGLRKLKSVRE